MLSSPPSYHLAEVRSDGLLPVHKSPGVGGRERWSDIFEIDDGCPIRLDVSQPEFQQEGQELPEVSLKKGKEVVDYNYFYSRDLEEVRERWR